MESDSFESESMPMSRMFLTFFECIASPPFRYQAFMRAVREPASVMESMADASMSFSRISSVSMPVYSSTFEPTRFSLR